MEYALIVVGVALAFMFVVVGTTAAVGYFFNQEVQRVHDDH